MKIGTIIRYNKFGIKSEAVVSQVYGYHVIAHDGHTTVRFPKKIN